MITIFAPVKLSAPVLSGNTIVFSSAIFPPWSLREQDLHEPIEGDR
jgi:hypothetical protein